MFRAQELEGHRLDQDETLHLWSELSSCLESQGRAIRVAHQMNGPLRLLGKLEQNRKIGLAGKDLVFRPGVRLPISNEIRSEHTPVRRKLLDQGQPFFVGGGAAMGNDDRGAFTLLEIGDLDAVSVEALHGVRPTMCSRSPFP